MTARDRGGESGRAAAPSGRALVKWIMALAAVGVLAGAGYAMLPTGSRNGDSKTQRTADMATVRTQAFEITTTATGELEARNKLEIRSKLEQESTIGFIIAEGTKVKVGELLIQLNTDQIQQRLDEENPRMLTARAELDAAEKSFLIQEIDNTASLRKAELKVELADLARQQWLEGDVVKKRQELELKIDRATLELERLATKYVRSQELLDEGFLSKDECDRDEVAYIEAISAFTTSLLERQVYEDYEFLQQQKQKQADVEEAKEELLRVRQNNEIELNAKRTKRDIEREQVTMVENRLNKLRQQLDSATIKAPQDGLVVYASSVEGRNWGGNDGPLQIGQQVYPNQLLMILPDTSEMVASIRVHESIAGRIREGLIGTVKVDAAGGKVFIGRVESVGVIAESGGWRDPNLREYVVKLGLETEGESLKPAMRCEGRLVLESVDETLTVPIQAIFSEGPVQFVYEPRGTKFARVPIRVGRRSDTVAEIKLGVGEGRTVLLREPSAGEIIGEAWDTEQLKLAGYKLGEDGQVVAEGGPAVRPGGRQGKRGGEGRDVKAAAAPEAAPEAATETTEAPATAGVDSNEGNK